MKSRPGKGLTWKESDSLMTLEIYYTNPELLTSRLLLCVRKINLFESLLFYFADVVNEVKLNFN